MAFEGGYPYRGMSWGGGAGAGGATPVVGGGQSDMFQKLQDALAAKNSPMNDFLTPEMFMKLGLSPEQAQMAMMKQFGLNGSGGIGGAGADNSATWARLSFDQERAKADDAYRAAQLAMAQGDMQLGQQKLQEAQRASQASERLQGRQNQISERNSDVGAMNTAAGAYGDMGTMQTNAFNAKENATIARGGLKARGAENMTNLTSTLGNLGQAQAKLGLDILSTPRNAIPAFMMAAGQRGAPGAAAFNPTNLLGFDASQMQGLIQNAISSANQVGQGMPDMGDLDMSGIMQALSGLADRALKGGVAPEAGQPNYDASQWNRQPSNQPSNPMIDEIIQRLAGGGGYGGGQMGGGGGGGGMPAAPAGPALPVPRQPYNPAIDRDPWESPLSNTMAGASTWKPGPVTWGGFPSNAWTPQWGSNPTGAEG